MWHDESGYLDHCDSPGSPYSDFPLEVKRENRIRNKIILLIVDAICKVIEADYPRWDERLKGSIQERIASASANIDLAIKALDRFLPEGDSHWDCQQPTDKSGA